MKSGMVAVIGRPNVGKSTLINALCGTKVAIVSNKPQTTRNRICAVTRVEGTQLVMIDTPGFHKPRNKLGEYMHKVVVDSLSGVDAILLVVEPKTHVGKPEALLLERVTASGTPCVLVVNKTDTISRVGLLLVFAVYEKQARYAAIVPVCAKTGEDVDVVGRELAMLMPEGPQLFPDDRVSDQPDHVFACELLREKLLWALNEEIPHGIACVIERWEDNEELLRIGVAVIVERESHKAIVIGRGGEVLKKAGALARADMEKFFNCKVFLETWVKVKKNWRDDPSRLKGFGFDG